MRIDGENESRSGGGAKKRGQILCGIKHLDACSGIELSGIVQETRYTYFAQSAVTEDEDRQRGKKTELRKENRAKQNFYRAFSGLNLTQSLGE